MSARTGRGTSVADGSTGDEASGDAASSEIAAIGVVLVVFMPVMSTVRMRKPGGLRRGMLDAMGPSPRELLGVAVLVLTLIVLVVLFVAAALPPVAA